MPAWFEAKGDEEEFEGSETYSAAGSSLPEIGKHESDLRREEGIGAITWRRIG